MNALMTVTATASPITHLIVSSPAVRGCQAGAVGPATLCGQVPEEIVAVNPGNVECVRCLGRAADFLDVPAFAPLAGAGR